MPMTKEKPERLTYTVPEAAAVLGVCRNLLYYEIQRGKHEDMVIRIGNRVLISKVALEKKLGGATSTK